MVFLDVLPHTTFITIGIREGTLSILKVNRQQNEQSHINEPLKAVLNWFTANNLCLNAAKIKFIKFSSPHVK